MSYCVSYDSEPAKKRNVSRFRRVVLSCFVFAGFLYLVAAFWPDGTKLLKQMLFPGDAEKTLQAAETFAQEINCGYSVLDAVENFFVFLRNGGYSG